MVCPYRLVMTSITAILSVFWIHKATAPPAAIVQASGAQKKAGVDGASATQPTPPARKWTASTVLLAVSLILLHVDLLVTGHLRSAVKGFLASR
jgi:hypothetical protein